jgi:iron complex transport system substrate-binding protein
MKALDKTAGIIFLVIALASSLFVSCAAPAETTAPAPNTIIDQVGRTVTVPSIPQRIVSLSPSNTEILFALGLGDRVVGVTDYCDYPPEAKEKTHIGGFWTPDVETIVSLAPDLVVAQALHQAEVIPKLEGYGLNVIVLEPKTVDEVLDAINLVGQITGNTKEAAALVKSLQSRIDRVTDKTKDLPESQRPGVFYITWHDPLMSVGSGNIGDDLITRAGGSNIFHDLEGSVTVSLEEVVQANPDVIIAGVGMGSGEDLPLQFTLEEPRLAGTNARLNNQVYSISMDLPGRAGPRIVDALEQFARFIHPELFKE